MPGEVDPLLIGVLQSVMGFTDTLRDAGAAGDIAVRLNREDGLRLLEIIAGASNPEAEEWSQRDRPRKPGVNSLKVAQITPFEWPRADAARQRPEASRLFSSRPQWISAPGNDNSRNPPRYYGFEEETPALR